MKYAVIDIGSNSVRLLLQSDGKTLYKGINSTRLGEGIAHFGALSMDAITRTALTINDFKEQALAQGVAREHIFVFATAAVRSAKNKSVFLAVVQEIAGLNIDVISGEEEANIGLLGALGKQDGGIIDIGGASTEFTVRVEDKIAYSKSLDIGAVRLYDLCGRDRVKLNDIIQNKIKEFEKINCSVPIYGIGGTATSLSALALGLKKYDAQKVHGYILQKQELKNMVDKLFQKTPQALVENSCISLKRAEIIAGGGLLLLNLMEYFNLNTVTISENDNMEGYLLKRGLQ